ncbi:MAG: penicillin-binding transpeptidase domain-containing protein [Xanthomonadales bacterium]|jgi:beta-lactamase class D|nr:penicillin-binding transpeptidase domain-containing protein [Xanthomonadales bacterium]
MFRPLLSTAIALGLALHAAPANASLMLHFKNQYGALEIYDAKAKLSFRVNPARLTTPLQACGMANFGVAVSALKRGKLKAGGTQLAWDQAKYPQLSVWPKSWAQPQTLDRAFRHNVEWYFSELAQQVGTTALTADLKALGFVAPAGTPGTPGDWQISTLNLVELMKKLQAGQLPITPAAHVTLREALKREAEDGRTMYALGARCMKGGETPFAWRAGYVLGNAQPIYWGVHLQGRTLTDLRGESARIVSDSLAEMDYWPAEDTAVATPAVSTPASTTVGN